ncbi:Acyl-(acyl-carrier-protein)--UDP-N- acetylglucosamine O-acyltransferase [Liberibacter crescens BT-1]|uniref:Acyl-(Acyl-carrier-protein)--UDP-N-acetylglucosamine O-acyltransferase n=1 Tax=Liberibacter crescens (strain BT-1) TaxID=1215343 RepID=L0ETT7_LIBCB|nr:acyl-ACP--UDP-N-acetylglucosamine O-acyltransferase [Liberibacter crescens]AGA64043.1 Acyl-(acyl-carrier-protein)--UDP-N- acetylglucosamine O-acyltransferase [Liberibacter crescens BT-1]AMC12347.1 UDP-N-acetylglucosamine acyltransferase [Liberibacter crescens]
MNSFAKSVVIHPMSIVEEGAIIGEDTVIGPFCKVGSEVKLGVGVRLISNCIVMGKTTIEDFTTIFPMAVIGGETQSINHSSLGTELYIGKRCVIREGVTINRGTVEYLGKTTIGDRNTFLTNVHIAHDCMIGNDVVLSNNVMIAGHVIVGDRAIFGGGSAAHQFTRIGCQAFVSGFTAVAHDVIPYGMAYGIPAVLRGINVVGMKRFGIDRTKIHIVREVYNAIFKDQHSIHEKAEAIREQYSHCSEALDILDFILLDRQRHLSSPHQTKGHFFE